MPAASEEEGDHVGRETNNNKQTRRWQPTCGFVSPSKDHPAMPPNFPVLPAPSDAVFGREQKRSDLGCRGSEGNLGRCLCPTCLSQAVVRAG